MPMTKISLVRDFSDSPGGRYQKQGAYSGEEFRDQLLRPALKNPGLVEIELDGALGFPASFLDEVFGRLVDFEGKDVFERIQIKLTDNDAALELLRSCVREHGGNIK